MMSRNDLIIATQNGQKEEVLRLIKEERMKVDDENDVSLILVLLFLCQLSHSLFHSFYRPNRMEKQLFGLHVRLETGKSQSC